MKIEELDKILAYPAIQNYAIKEKAGDFNRVRKFTVFGNDYKIIWYVNQCYLFSGGVQVLFKNAKLSNTWPERSKMNIQFYQDSDTPCAILKIEDYEVTDD